MRVVQSYFFFQAQDGIRDDLVTGVQTCALPICPLDPGRVEDRGQILHPLFERGHPLDRVREPRARLVEADHPSKAGQAADRTLDRRELERRLNMGDEPRDEDEIEGSVADDGVGDLEAATLGVGDPGLDHSGARSGEPQPEWASAGAAAKLTVAPLSS